MNKERLIKIAEFLEKLPEHKFDFSNYVILGSKQPAEALANPEEHCGTTACAIGWLPAIFPKSFIWINETNSWGNDLVPALVEENYWSERNIREFLEIDSKSYNFLFIPGLSPLNDKSKSKEVAEQIRQFVETDGEIMFSSY